MISLDDMVATIDARIAAIDEQLATFDELTAERKRLRKARTALGKVFGQPAAPKAGRQARPTSAAGAAAIQDAAVLAALTTPISASALALRLKTTPGKLDSVLRRLLEAKKVTRTGQTSQTRWAKA